MLDYLSQFHFIRPLWLLLLLPFAALLWLQWRGEDQRRQWQKLLPAHLLEALTLGQEGWRSHLPLKILLVLFFLAVIVVSGPTWQRQPSPFGEDKAPLIVLLDLSESMSQGDLPPSRLERAKQKIQDLIAIRDGGRTSLILYAGTAHVAMPMTQDQAMFLPLLHAADEDIMPRPGKFAERALPLVDLLMADDPSPATVLLITDGVGAGTESAFREYFKESRHQLLVLGIGQLEQSARMPFQWDELQQLADVAGGSARQITLEDDDVVWLSKRIERHMLLNGDSVMPWQDMGYWLLVPLSLLFLLWFRKGWTVQWSWALFALGLWGQPVEAAEWRFADLWATPEQQGRWYFEQGDYLTAAERFQDPFWKGLAYYYGRDFKSAHSYFLRIDSTAARFAAANALARQREYVAARDLYDLILQEAPDFPNAQANRDLLQKIIDAINLMSASQANTEQDGSRELGDAPKTSDGADEKVPKELLIEETLSAEQLLQDEALNEKWMRRVQADPANFLRAKFAVQEAR